ncbi:DHA1 family bicyclomycin/chloramphenicol resistance-like MFS transporter [Rhodoligotrophos appendicifer]|uniref:multidrug effflux MFS transporter n=1 Tax=Rhodoligotrophos appendicifer TaxID=987056 RepID=UPI001FE5DBF1|nr:multidrug effflux MFS transporter [Rhodoligotrophos appendicifer]
MTALLAILTAMGPLSTDMYLPSLPSITHSLNTDAASVQLTLSVFLVGFAVGQIIYGPLSDRFGRRPILLIGLSLFGIASAGCMLANTIEILILARFGQAVSACAAIVIARAIVRDLYRAEQAGRVLSLMGAIMGIVPALAPLLGGVLEPLFGWRSVFGAISILASLVLLIVALFLPETLTHSNRQPATIKGMLSSFGVLLNNFQFRRFVGMVCLCYGGLFAFISGSSFILQEHYGLDEIHFSFSFSTAVLGYISGSLFGARFGTRIGLNRMVSIGACMLAVGGLTMIILVRLQPPAVWHVLIPITIYMCGVGLTLPQCMAGAITPFPERAGAASSLMGFLQMSFGALVGVLVGRTVHLGPMPLAMTIAAVGLCCFGISLMGRSSPHRRHEVR